MEHYIIQAKASSLQHRIAELTIYEKKAPASRKDSYKAKTAGLPANSTNPYAEESNIQQLAEVELCFREVNLCQCTGAAKIQTDQQHSRAPLCGQQADPGAQATSG